MSDESQKPDPQVQRSMIEGKRDQLRAAGFDAQLEVISLNAQKVESPGEERDRVKMVREFRLKAENCYLGAKELDALLSELPEPEKEKSLV